MKLTNDSCGEEVLDVLWLFLCLCVPLDSWYDSGDHGIAMAFLQVLVYSRGVVRSDHSTLGSETQTGLQRATGRNGWHPLGASRHWQRS